MVQLVLTKEQVERAVRREGVQHPVITVLEHYEPQIAQLKGYSAIKTNQGQQDYIDRNYGFLADAIEEAGDFSLGPLDLVAIWSKAMQVWPDNRYPRYSLAGMVSSSYGISGVPNPDDWRRFPRYWLEQSKLPKSVLQNQSGLSYVKRRLGEISRSIDEFDFYLYGTRESPMETAAKLAKKARDGDKEAKIELDRLIAQEREVEKQPTTPLLNEIGENFGNGMITIRLDIEDAIQKRTQ